MRPPPTPQITPADRLGLTLCFAVILHAVVLLGVTFSPEDEQSPQTEPLEIILVQKQSEAPDEAKLLAQANLEGGGESDESERPATPVPAPFPEPVAKVTAPPPEPVAPAPTEPAPEKLPEPAPEPEPAEPIKQVAVETPEPAAVEKAPPEPEKPEPDTEPEPDKAAAAEPKPSEPEPEVAETPAEPAPSRPSAAELVSSSMETAALNAEIQRKLKAKAERPRRKFISASTQEYKYASYMEAWRSKVERVGNLNYPEEARKRGLTGSLILDVALKPDGSVEQITVRRSSGNKLLDDAAIRIVKLAEPFAPFPEDIREETDILHITRTWQFVHGERFQ